MDKSGISTVLSFAPVFKLQLTRGGKKTRLLSVTLPMNIPVEGIILFADERLQKAVSLSGNLHGWPEKGAFG